MGTKNPASDGWMESDRAATGLASQGRDLATHAAAHARDLTFPISGPAPRNRAVTLGRHATGSQREERDQEQTEHRFLGRDHEVKVLIPVNRCTARRHKRISAPVRSRDSGGCVPPHVLMAPRMFGPQVERTRTGQDRLTPKSRSAREELTSRISIGTTGFWRVS